MMKRRLKTPLLLGIIGSSIIFVLGLIGLIYFVNYRNFFELCEVILNEDVSGEGITLQATILELFPFLTVENIRTTMYIYLIISNVLAMVLSIPNIVFSLICMKDVSLDVEAFQKRNKLHIFLIISFAISYIANSYEQASMISQGISFVSIGAVVLMFIGFIKTIQEVRLNKYYYNMLQARKAQEEKMQNERYSFDKSKFNQPEGNQIGEENLEKPEIKEEVKVDQSKLDELYSLLAKLEKSYKNGEITEEDYQRMKKTILENYMN